MIGKPTSANSATAPSDIETLLPWYAKGTLSTEDTARVDAYLAGHPEMRGALALIAEELKETVAANENLGLPSASARNRLMANIAAADAGRAPEKASLWLRMQAAWAALLPQGVSPVAAFGGMAAALVITVQAAALAVLIAGGAPQEGEGVHLAGGSGTCAQTGTALLVRFADSATAGEIAAFLGSSGAVIVDGPKPGGLFKVCTADAQPSGASRAAFTEKLRARSDIVTFVTPAGGAVK